jgi:tetratricopeptide (TPR) repeat protein
LAYLTCLIGGFIRLWWERADFTTLLLLIGGSGLLSLTCLYYAGFWKPELQDKNAPSSELPDSDERVKAQRSKHRSRQHTRRLAVVGLFAVPLLTFAGFWVWRSMPAPRVLLLVANFDGVEQQNYRVTENILRNLRNTTRPYADVKVVALNRTITEQQGSEVARAAGEQKKASIVIWGEYGVTADHVQIGTHFEVLKPPTYFPELGKTASGAAQTAAIAELTSFKLQTRLSNETSYLTLFTLGMVQYAKADWDGAIVRFKSALEQVKEPVAALSKDIVFFQLANSHYSKGDYKNAIADYNQAIKLKPDYAEAYYNRGLTYNYQGNYTAAIADYNQAIKLKPDYAEAYNNRGLAYADQGNYTEAIADYNQAIKLKPDYAKVYNNRGLAYADQGNYTEAIADLTQAIKLKPDDAGAYSNRGNAYAGQGNYTAAIADYNQAIKLKPDFAEAYYNRGLAYYYRSNYTAAIADYNQAIKLKPDFADTYNNRGIAYTRQGNYIVAIADYNQATKLKPDYADAYYNKACIYSLQREVKAAIENLQQAIRLDAKLRDAAKKDSDFDNIRQDRQFQALVGK